MNIDLSTLNSAELALISKMPHIESETRFMAADLLLALVGEDNYVALRREAESAISDVSATDAALFAEAQA